MLRQTYYACALYTYTNLYTQICIVTQIVIQYSQPSTVLKFWKNFERNVHCCTKYLCSIEIFQIPSVQCDVQICISPTSGDKLNMKKVSLVGMQLPEKREENNSRRKAFARNVEIILIFFR
jgi:hypothetical protein